MLENQQKQILVPITAKSSGRDKQHRLATRVAVESQVEILFSIFQSFLSDKNYHFAK